MVDLALLQSVSYMAGALGVCVAAVYYIMVLRTNQRSVKATLETRQAQLFMGVYDKFSSKEFSDDMNKLIFNEPPQYASYEEFQEKYGYEKNPQYYSSLVRMAMLLEGVGVLVKRGLIDVGFVDDLMSVVITRFWELTSSAWNEYRVREGDQAMWEFVEYLYNEVKPIYQRQWPVIKSTSSQ
jgi:hypothetical protein